MGQQHLTNKEIEIVNETKKTGNYIPTTECKYLYYDAEGPHCSIHRGMGVGDYCKWHYQQDCEWGVAKTSGMQKCDCCGKLSGDTEVLCSALEAVSFRYCGECAKKELEPYGVLIRAFAGIKWENILPHWQDVIEEVCSLRNVELSQFQVDCEMLHKVFQEQNC